MKDQLTVRLPARLARALAAAARKRGLKRADIVRQSLAHDLLGAPGLRDLPTGDRRPIARIEDLVGSLESTLPDLGSESEKHLRAGFPRRRHG